MDQQTEYDKVLLPSGAVWNCRLLKSGAQCSAQTPRTFNFSQLSMDKLGSYCLTGKQEKSREKREIKADT